MKDHRNIDERSWVLACLVAERVKADPSILPRARANLDRWLRTSSPGVRPVLMEWKSLLEGPHDELLQVLTGRDERATRLRQSSPFAGVLTATERNEVLRRFARHESIPT